MTLNNKKSSGFALLMSLIVVSVVISVGLSVLDLTLKQIQLSTNSEKSEIAFHAANAGLECARYWRLLESTDMESGLPISTNCFAVSSVNTSASTVSGVTNGAAYTYDTEYTWGSSAASMRCSKTKSLVIVSDPTVATVVNNMSTLIPGYPSGNTKTCNSGGRCTVISVRGYSRECSNITLPGTVQREVLLEL